LHSGREKFAFVFLEPLGSAGLSLPTLRLSFYREILNWSTLSPQTGALSIPNRISSFAFSRTKFFSKSFGSLSNRDFPPAARHPRAGFGPELTRNQERPRDRTHSRIFFPFESIGCSDLPGGSPRAHPTQRNAKSSGRGHPGHLNGFGTYAGPENPFFLDDNFH